MAIRWEAKRPNEVRDHVIDWSSFLDGDTIATSTVTADGLTIDSETNDTTTASLVISGGTEGTLARITNTITTAGGRTETEVFTVYVTEFPEPLSLAAAKEHLRVTDNAQDATICACIRAAREYCEDKSDLILVRRRVESTFDAFVEPLKLYKKPFVGDAEVTYTDADGAEQTVASVVVQDWRNPVRVWPAHGETWPITHSRGGIRVTYTAGYAEGEVPETFVQAIKLLVGHWFANREGVVVGEASKELELTVRSLIAAKAIPAI